MSCSGILPTTQPVMFDRYIVLPAICAEVDEIPQFVIPVILIQGTEETIQYRTELGVLIEGIVTETDPCNCPCGDCE